jgi:hypothetical protein
MNTTYSVRQRFENGQVLWLLECTTTGKKLMYFSNKDHALLRCEQLMKLARVPELKEKVV